MPEAAFREGWTRVRFGDVVKLTGERSGNPAADGFERFVGLEHMDPGDLTIRRWGDVASGTTFTSVFRPGEVLFGKRRAYQRKVAVATFSGVCSGDIYVLKPSDDNLLPELIPFICLSDAFFDHAVGTSAGSLSPRTNWKSLARFEFALPPLSEQQRLAAVLGAIQAVIQSHAALFQSAGRARAAYANSKFADLSSHDTIGSSAGNGVGHRWSTLELRHLVAAKGLVRGPFGGSLKKEVFVASGYQVYEQSHAISGDLSRGRYFITEQKYREMDRFHVEEGDLIMSCSGTIGRVALVTDGCPRGVINQALLKIRPDRNIVDPRYLLAFLSSDVFASSLARLSVGSAMANVTSVRQLERIRVPAPPLAEQRTIAGALAEQEQALADISERLQGARRLLTHVIHEALSPAE